MSNKAEDRFLHAQPQITWLKVRWCQGWESLQGVLSVQDIGGKWGTEKPSTCSRSARKQITGTESDLSPPFPSECLVRKGQGAGQGEQELRAAEQNAGCNHSGLLFCFALLVLKLPTSPGHLFQIPAVKVQLSLSDFLWHWSLPSSCSLFAAPAQCWQVMARECDLLWHTTAANVAWESEAGRCRCFTSTKYQLCTSP